MINCFAPVYGNFGYAVQSRNFFKNLAAFLELKIYPLSTNRSGYILEHDIARLVKRPLAVDPTQPSICLAQASQLTAFPGRPRIGYTIFEGTDFPEEEWAGITAVDYLWVPSRWAKKILVEKGLQARNIGIVPGGVDVDCFNPEVKPHPKFHNPNLFTFLSVGKWETRKGHRELVEVFTQTFKNRRDVRLLMAASNPFRPGEDVSRILDEMELPEYPLIETIEPLDNDSEMAQLYRCADLFLLFTRAEGWGLPIVEALAAGVAVLTTDYGPMCDYLSQDYSFPVKPVALEPITASKAYPRGAAHGLWARPDYNYMSRVMQVAVERPQVLKKMGRRAARAMRKNWNWKKSAQKAVADLKKRNIV